MNGFSCLDCEISLCLGRDRSAAALAGIGRPTGDPFAILINGLVVWFTGRAPRGGAPGQLENIMYRCYRMPSDRPQKLQAAP
jgi:hypothetical protein